jgi:hypothetical protein
MFFTTFGIAKIGPRSSQVHPAKFRGQSSVFSLPKCYVTTKLKSTLWLYQTAPFGLNDHYRERRQNL